jgi:predicted secreted hydrolase
MMISENKCILSLLALLLIGGLMTALVPLALAGSTGQNQSNSSPPLGEIVGGNAGSVFHFPADHLMHQPQSVVEDPALFLEWLYWTGTLKDIKTGELLGFQYTLFQQNLKTGLIGYVNHAAISDVYNSQHPRYRYATLPDQAHITNGTDSIKGDYWRYQDLQTNLTYWMDQDAWSILTSGNVSNDGGHGKNMSLNLTLVNDKLGYYLHRPGGVSAMGACEKIDVENMTGMTYYYSHPAMNTTGTVTIDGREIRVGGDSWFDHQWGGFGRCLPAWDWFSMRLDNGSYVMLYNLKDPFLNDLPSMRGLTYIDSRGNATGWTGEDAANLKATRWWTSDLFGFRYPLEWVINTPVGRFALEPYFDEQTMNVAKGEVKYWEGIVRVRETDHSGKQIGTGYMELAGYAPISSQMNRSVKFN